MSEDSVCGKCSLSVDQSEELYIACDGYCARFFHTKCTGLSESEVSVIQSNIIWLCDECLGKFLRARDIKEGTIAERVVNTGAIKTSIEDEIQGLKDAVAGIMNTMSKLLPVADSTDTIESTSLPSFRHSTPVSFELHDGTNACGNDIVNAGPSSPQQCVVETIEDKMFSLLLTNIDASVAESEVRQMVVTALGTHDPEHIDVIKLVPYWKRRGTFDFVSFKVVMDKRWRSKAMEHSTWPRGVKFREFFKRRTTTWKPCRL